MVVLSRGERQLVAAISCDERCCQVNLKLPMPVRRTPRQKRSQETVAAILEAVRLLLRRTGAEASVTTNSIAAAAGVSIGSLYQYFPNKQAIYRALLDSHLMDMQRIIERWLVQNHGATLEVRVRSLVEAIVAEHARDAELYDLLFSQTSERTAVEIAHEEHVRSAFRTAIGATQNEEARELDRTLFVLMNMVESLTHGAVLRRPPHLSLAAATDAAADAVLAYLRAECGGGFETDVSGNLRPTNICDDRSTSGARTE